MIDINLGQGTKVGIEKDGGWGREKKIRLKIFAVLKWAIIPNQQAYLPS